MQQSIAWVRYWRCLSCWRSSQPPTLSRQNLGERYEWRGSKM